MGQISRQNRAYRFMKQFEDLFVASSRFKAGQKLTVKSVGLGSREASGEEVVEFVTVQDEAGNSYTFETGRSVLFDPEYVERDDVAEILMRELGISEAEALAGLKQANLFD